jgi:hypothetical protein
MMRSKITNYNAQLRKQLAFSPVQEVVRDLMVIVFTYQVATGWL